MLPVGCKLSNTLFQNREIVALLIPECGNMGNVNLYNRMNTIGYFILARYVLYYGGCSVCCDSVRG
jgi:hypothetical protein